TTYKVVGTDNIADNETAARIVTYGVTVVGPDGPIFEAAGLGLDPAHPRYIGSVLAQDPPDATARLANPVAITSAASGQAKGLDEALSKDLSPQGTRTIVLRGGL